MFLHGSWLHLVGNMVFLGIFGNNVEDSYGHARYLVFYLLGGWAAAATQAAVTLAAGSAADAATATLGASGAISAVMGAYVILYPKSRVKGLFGIFPVRLTAWFYLGVWFLYQLIQGGTGLANNDLSAGGVAIYAHVGGFLFGFVVTWWLARSGRIVGASAQPERARNGASWRRTRPGGGRR
jgi:membrane associated rhomboid family serine protease